MGKGGDASAVNTSRAELLVNERNQKIASAPNFYWDHDEEPHGKRYVCDMYVMCVCVCAAIDSHWCYVFTIFESIVIPYNYMECT